MKKLGLLMVAGAIQLGLSAQNKVEIGDIQGKAYYEETEWGKVYYEVYGKGDPLLVLHGNGGSAKGRHHMVPDLIEHWQVILMDSQCHGNSSCPDGNLDYFEMAKDVNLVMEKVGHPRYTIWGHSDGGILGLILGYKYTDKIHRMLLSGANARVEGLEPQLIGMINAYDHVADPTMKKHLKLMAHQREIPLDSLRKVEVPVMLMVGDRDAVTMEHTMQIFNALPMSNLCVLPATSHFISNEKPNHIVYWLKEFRKPFSAPSTVEIAEQMAKSILSEK